MTKPILVFDLDGTLVDTAPDLIDSINAVVAAEGLEAVDAQDLIEHVSLGGRMMITHAFAVQGRTVDKAEVDALFAAFLDHYMANMPGRSRPYPGVLEAMDRFSAEGYIHAVCTNKMEHSAVRLLTGLGIGERFRVICGQDTFPFRKPDPRHLTETIARAGGDAARAIMIGDSETDIRTAQAAGIPVVAVDFGYTPVHVREFGPDAVISHYDELTGDLVARIAG